MNYLKSSLKDFLDDLSAKKPVPGGGSASALVSVIGVGCLLMVINYTLGKNGYEKYEKELKKIFLKLKIFQIELLNCMKLDINLFSKVAQAYKIPKDTKKQKKLRYNKIKKFLLKVNLVEQKIIKTNYKIILLSKRLVDIGNKNLISDTGCGILFLRTGAESALLNLLINIKFLKRNRKIVRSYINLIKKINYVSEKLLKKINKIF